MHNVEMHFYVELDFENLKKLTSLEIYDNMNSYFFFY